MKGLVRIDWWDDCDNFKQSAWLQPCWDRTEPFVEEETSINGFGELKVKYSRVVPRCAFETTYLTDAQLTAFACIRSSDNIRLTDLDIATEYTIKDVDFSWRAQDLNGCLNIGRFVFEVEGLIKTGCCCT